MSEQIVNEVERQGFNRFDDNLCEILLNQLLIKDKIRFECISKQWKSLIFNKQQKLVITCNEMNDKTSCEDQNEIKLSADVKNIRFHVLYSIEKSFPILENILKKFKSIKEIEFSGMSIEMTGKLLEIIGNNCSDLEKLSLNNIFINDINEENVKVFGEKCGLNLQSIVISFVETNSHNNRLIESLLKFTPNIRSLNCETNSELIWKQNIYFSKLEEIYLDESFTYQEFKTFTDNYNKQIKKIHVRLNNNEIHLNNTLTQLSRFESLVDLSALLEFSNEDSTSSIDNELVMIANKCLKLENLLLYVDIESEVKGKAITGQWLNILGNFRALKSCKFYLYLSESSDLYVNTYYGNVESLKDCKNLKHLSLDMTQLNDKNFEGIDLYLPQLTSLKIISENYVLTDQMLHKLAKMPKLSAVSIENREIDEQDINFGEHNIMTNKSDITDSGVCDVIINCPNIKTIQLKCDSSITSESIEAFVNRANTYPKVEYNFGFSSNSSGVNDFMNSKSNDLPKNLKLKLIFIAHINSSSL